MFKIILLNGSPRKKGSTAAILHKIESVLIKQENVSVKFIDISDLKFESCSGCCYCYKTGHCYMNDDAESLSLKIEKADGIIIGSPTYASNISGQLKEFIDRGHFVIEQLLLGKYALSVVTGENYGSKNASSILNKLLQYSGAKLSGKIIYKLPFNNDPLEDKKLEKRLEHLSLKFYQDIIGMRSYIRQGLFHSLIFHMGLKPFVFKKKDLYKGVRERWQNHSLIKT